MVVDGGSHSHSPLPLPLSPTPLPSIPLAHPQLMHPQLMLHGSPWMVQQARTLWMRPAQAGVTALQGWRIAQPAVRTCRGTRGTGEGGGAGRRGGFRRRYLTRNGERRTTRHTWNNNIAKSPLIPAPTHLDGPSDRGNGRQAHQPRADCGWTDLKLARAAAPRRHGRCRRRETRLRRRGACG